MAERVCLVADQAEPEVVAKAGAAAPVVDQAGQVAAAKADSEHPDHSAGPVAVVKVVSAGPAEARVAPVVVDPSLAIEWLPQGSNRRRAVANGFSLS